MSHNPHPSCPTHEHAAWNRRSFVKSLFAGAGALLVPGIGGLQAAAAPLLAKGNPDRILLLLQLDGGNDGLNTVVPISDDRYFQQRPDLAITNALGLTTNAGLHPALTNLHGFWQDNQMAILQSVGYPDMSQSHFASADYWNEASDPSTGFLRTGWIGRTMLRTDPDYFTSPPAHPLALGVGASYSPLMQSAAGSIGVAFKDVWTFERVAQTGSLHSLDGLQGGPPGEQQRFVRDIGNRAFRFGSEIATRHGNASNTRPYPNSHIGKSLAAIARLIRGGMSTRVYHVSRWGFDTHAYQADEHADILSDIDDSLGAFYADLKSDGLDQRVMTLTFSEFGRRVYQNGQRGTDHGEASVMFALGPGVTPDIYGAAPDLSGENVPVHSDFRSVYTEALTDWMGIPQSDVAAALNGTYAPMGFISGGGLPVELAGFNGFATEAGVQLKWATLSETDADHFVVERSFRGSTSEFEAIGQVQATGSATRGATYAFVDPSPHAGPTSYRLRQVDLDGRFTFYGPITVESARVADFQLSAYPNPSRGRAVVNI
ncbi:MAG: DUF1501 domain-containing protein, partial [Bacteroidota bacterium]